MKKLILIAALALCGAAAFAQQRMLVVTPFELWSGLEAAALNNLQDKLVNAFINTGRFQVLNRNALDLFTEEQKFQLSDWSDEKKTAQMGKALNADYIVPKITIDGAAKVLSAQILDVNTANWLSVELKFANQRDAWNKMDDFVSRIVQRIDAICLASKYKIGDTGPGGGIVFHAEGNGGMEVSRSLGSYKWDDAIKAAKKYNGGGKSDWRLPDISELGLIFMNLKQKGLGDFVTGWYWSSSQYNTDDAWEVNFGDGRQVNYTGNLSNLGSVCAVRSF